jgi:hypothetical protein
LKHKNYKNKMATIIKSASVKVMLSYNYNHFEASMVVENEEGVTVHDVDNARKDCQRLCDKAIKQYQIAKNVEQKRINLSAEKRILEREVSSIKEKPKETWSVTDKAKVKALEDHNWELKFDYEDDYNEEVY